MTRHEHQSAATANEPSLKGILHSPFTDGTHLLLLVSIAVGCFIGEARKTVMQPFSEDFFKGMLALFLLNI